MIILYRSLKSLNKIQHPFLIKQSEQIKKLFKKLGTQRNLFKLIKTFLSGTKSKPHKLMGTPMVEAFLFNL